MVKRLSNEEALALWRAGERDELIEKTRPLAIHLARQIAVSRGLPHEIDEYVGAAYLGLVEAVDSYDPERNDAFGAWAASRIRWALSTGRRRPSSGGQSASAKLLPMPQGPGGEPIELLPLDHEAETCEADLAGDGLASDDVERLAEAAVIQSRERAVLLARHGFEESWSTIARRLGLSVRRVRQLHDRALASVREAA